MVGVTDTQTTQTSSTTTSVISYPAHQSTRPFRLPSSHPSPSFSSQLLDLPPTSSPQHSLSTAAQAVAEAINKLLTSMSMAGDNDGIKQSRICYTKSMEVVNR